MLDPQNKNVTTVISDIKFENLSGKSIEAGRLMCVESNPCKGINLKNIDIVGAIDGCKIQNVYGESENVTPKSCHLQS